MSNLDLFIRVAIALCVILAVSQVIGGLMKYIGQPRVVGEMISGVILGPTLLGWGFPEASSQIFPKEIMPSLFVLSNIGLSTYMFLVGTEINLRLFTKKLLLSASGLSASTILIPFACGFLCAYIFHEEINVNNIPFVSFSIFIGTAMAITAFPMLARILQEKNILDTEIGSIAILSASIQDVVSWILLGTITAIITGGSYYSILIMVSGAVLLILVLFKLVRPLLSSWIEKQENTNTLSPPLFGAVIFLLIASALVTDIIGLYSVFGGFILGLSLPRKPDFLSAVSVRIKDYTVILFLPVFFAYSGLNTDLTKIASGTLLVPAICIVFFAFFSKILPAFTAMRFSGYSNSDALSIAALINARGLMELIVANIGMEYKIINQDVYSILVLIAITTTLSALPLYELSLKWKK